MTLGELIKYLREKPQDTILPDGFTHAHSYRGDYSCLAFEPAQNVRVSEMLREASFAMGTAFAGYKGGHYKMDEYTDVYRARQGHTGDEITELMLQFMFSGSELNSLRVRTKELELHNGQLMQENGGLRASVQQLQLTLTDALDNKRIGEIASKIAEEKISAILKPPDVECWQQLVAMAYGGPFALLADELEKEAAKLSAITTGFDEYTKGKSVGYVEAAAGLRSRMPVKDAVAAIAAITAEYNRVQSRQKPVDHSGIGIAYAIRRSLVAVDEFERAQAEWTRTVRVCLAPFVDVFEHRTASNLTDGCLIGYRELAHAKRVYTALVGLNWPDIRSHLNKALKQVEGNEFTHPEEEGKHLEEDGNGAD